MPRFRGRERDERAVNVRKSFGNFHDSITHFFSGAQQQHAAFSSKDGEFVCAKSSFKNRSDLGGERKKVEFYEIS